VDYIEISPEVDHDSSLAVPILTAYLQKHPDVKAIGTQHGKRHGVHREGAGAGGEEAGRGHRRRHRSGAGTIEGAEERLRQRRARSAALPAGLPAVAQWRAVEEITASPV